RRRLTAVQAFLDQVIHLVVLQAQDFQAEHEFDVIVRGVESLLDRPLFDKVLQIVRQTYRQLKHGDSPLPASLPLRRAGRLREPAAGAAAATLSAPRPGRL